MYIRYIQYYIYKIIYCSCRGKKLLNENSHVVTTSFVLRAIFRLQLIPYKTL